MCDQEICLFLTTVCGRRHWSDVLLVWASAQGSVPWVECGDAVESMCGHTTHIYDVCLRECASASQCWGPYSWWHRNYVCIFIFPALLVHQQTGPDSCCPPGRLCPSPASVASVPYCLAMPLLCGAQIVSDRCQGHCAAVWGSVSEGSPGPFLWPLLLCDLSASTQSHCAVSSPQPRSTSSFLVHTLLFGNPSVVMYT